MKRSSFRQPKQWANDKRIEAAQARSAAHVPDSDIEPGDELTLLRRHLDRARRAYVSLATAQENADHEQALRLYMSSAHGETMVKRNARCVKLGNLLDRARARAARNFDDVINGRVRVS